MHNQKKPPSLKPSFWNSVPGLIVIVVIILIMIARGYHGGSGGGEGDVLPQTEGLGEPYVARVVGKL